VNIHEYSVLSQECYFAPQLTVISLQPQHVFPAQRGLDLPAPAPPSVQKSQLSFFLLPFFPSFEQQFMRENQCCHVIVMSSNVGKQRGKKKSSGIIHWKINIYKQAGAFSCSSKFELKFSGMRTPRQAMQASYKQKCFPVLLIKRVFFSSPPFLAASFVDDKQKHFFGERPALSFLSDPRAIKVSTF